MGYSLQGAPHKELLLSPGAHRELLSLFLLLLAPPSSTVLPPPLLGGRMVISTPTSYHSPLLPASHKQIHSFQSIDLRTGWTLKTNLFFGIGYLRGGPHPRSGFLPPSIYC